MIISNWGINHNTADVGLREKVSINPDEIPQLLNILNESGVAESCILSTCNRTEIYSYNQTQAESTLIEAVATFKNIPRDELNEVSYFNHNMNAVNHLFRVTSSMDSMIIGEPEILGQVKKAYSMAVEFGSVKKVLSALFQRSFNIAKKIRTETNISTKPTSVGAVATKLALQIFGNSGVKEILILGAGQMAEVSLKNIMGQVGACKVTICNRTVEKAKQLAKAYGGSAIGFDDLDSALCNAEIVITSLGGDKAILTHPRLQKIQRERKGYPLFMIDLGVPRNISPDCNQLDDIYIYDMDDLHNFVKENKDYRNKIIVSCEPYLNEGIEEFNKWFSSLDNQILIKDIVNKNQQIVDSEITKSLKKLKNLNENEQNEIKHLVERVLKKSMHQPIHSLRNSSTEEKSIDWRKIFLG
jgi:glutamyl-tRNA reductase